MVGAYKSLGKDYEIIVRCNSDNTLIMPNVIDLDIKNFLKSKSDFSLLSIKTKFHLVIH